MYKILIGAVLSVGILLLGGVGQFAAKTCLVGGCHSPSEVMVGSDVIWSGVERLDQRIYKHSPSLHAESGTIVLDLPVFEKKANRTDASPKQLVHQGHWDGIARLFGENTDVFQQSNVHGLKGDHHGFGFGAAGELYLRFGVLRV